MNKTTKELKKGDRVLLGYGDQNGDIAKCEDFEQVMRLFYSASSYNPWEAEIAENREQEKGTIRFCRVYGFEDEFGSVYSHQIIAWKDEDGSWKPISHTAEQEKCRMLQNNLSN